MNLALALFQVVHSETSVLSSNANTTRVPTIAHHRESAANSNGMCTADRQNS